MKLPSTRLSRIPALILLGSIISTPLPVIAKEFESAEDESGQEYDFNNIYNDQIDLKRTSHDPEDDAENSMTWENDDEGEGDYDSDEDDTFVMEDEEDMIEN